MELFYRCFRLKLMLHKSRLSCLGQCILIYSDIKGVLFRMREETEFMPPDETLKQGRNRSWLLQRERNRSWLLQRERNRSWLLQRSPDTHFGQTQAKSLLF